MVCSWRAYCYSTPDKGAEYCDERVCLPVCVFVCPRSYLRNYTSDLHQIFCACYLWPVLSWRRSDILCTSGFIDDVMLAHKPRLLSVATQLKCSAHAALGLAINCAGQRTHRTAFRALIVTFQVAAPGVKSAVSDCLVGDCRKCTTCCSSRGSAAFRSACLRSCLFFRSYDQCLH